MTAHTALLRSDDLVTPPSVTALSGAELAETNGGGILGIITSAFVADPPLLAAAFVAGLVLGAVVYVLRH